MKHGKWLGLVVATAVALPWINAQGRTAAESANAGQAQPAGAANLSAAATEVIRLAGSGVGDEVVVA